MTEILRSGFGADLADCSRCELRGSCKQRVVQGERPSDWEPGGLMLIGEGPGKTEVSRLRPFVGRSGQLLDALMEAAGLDRARCWVTSATLGQPPPAAKDGGLHDRFPNAVYSCLPRLEAEIAAAQPRVIVTLGQAALVALAGHEVARSRMVDVTCANVDCDPATRKLTALGLQCAMADCSWFQICGDDPDAVKQAHGGKCPVCASSINRLRPKKLKCPTCGGKKRRVESYTAFENDLVLVARHGCGGAVFPAETLPSRLDQFGVKYVVPTYHPSYCLRPAPAKSAGEKRIGGQYAARVLVEHLEKARRLLRSDVQFRATMRIVTHPWEVLKFVADKTKRYAVDIETNSMDGAWGATKITCLGIATADREEAIVVDTRMVTDGMLDALQLFLEDASIDKFFHNGQFDRVVIRRLWGIAAAGCRTDTLIAHHSLYPDEEHGLGFCAHEFLDAPHWKVKHRKLKIGERDDLSGYPSFEELALYNARDTRSTALIDRVMRGPAGGRGRLDDEAVRATHDLDARMQDISVRMELFGLPVAHERVRVVQAHAEARASSLLAEMQDMVGRRTDAAGGPWLDSDGELWTPTGGNLQWALFDPEGPLRLQAFAYTSGGKNGKPQPSTAKEALARMTDQHEFVPKLIEWRKYSYVLANYIHGSALRVQADGRLHPQWKVYGTGTTRWTSNPNFQNWSKAQGDKDELLNLRSLIVAPPGRMLIGADYGALELRVLADLCQDPALIARLMSADEARKLEPECDPHAYMAWKTFGNAYLHADTKKKKALRDVVKRVVYGLNYGAGAETVLAAIYDGGYDGPPLTLATIQLIITTYFREYPRIGKWRERIVAQAEQDQEIRSWLGSRRIFPLGDAEATVLMNYPIQSSAANLVNSQLALLDDGRITAIDPTAEFVAQVHDAVYIECDEKCVEALCPVVTDTLTCTRSMGGGIEMLYPATADASLRWDQC